VALRKSQETLRAAGLIVDRGKSNGERVIKLGLVAAEDE
jgi:hypothetical protein